MGFFSNLFSAIKKAANWVIGIFTGSNDEEKAREIKSKIRNNKKVIEKTRQENEELRESLKTKRRSNEYLRRGIINNYYKAQIELIESVIEIVKDINKQAYNKLKQIRHNLKGQKSLKLPAEYYDLNDQLHNEIHESKLILEELYEKKNELKHLSRMLVDENYGDYIPHGKLGSKKLLGEIISAQSSELEDEYSEEQIIEVGDLTFYLEKKCKSCKSYVSSIMHYCFVCGEEINNEFEITKFARKKNSHLTCENCNSPLLNNWDYCPNCGEEFDPYYLKEYYRKTTLKE